VPGDERRGDSRGFVPRGCAAQTRYPPRFPQKEPHASDRSTQMSGLGLSEGFRGTVKVQRRERRDTGGKEGSDIFMWAEGQALPGREEQG